MENPTLDEAAFQGLGGNRAAFLALADATSDVRAAYAATGLMDAPPPGGVRRVVRVVDLPAGMRLFKLTWGAPTGDSLSSWWSAVDPFEENEDGAGTMFEDALLNGVSLREMVRFASAVSIDWNKLAYYVEVTLAVDIRAFWGQFAPQLGLQGDDDSVTDAPGQGGEDQWISYGDGEPKVYLPDVLGGFGGWQLYVPAFKAAFITPDVTTIGSTDAAALAAHLGIPPERVAELKRLGDRMKP